MRQQPGDSREHPDRREDRSNAPLDDFSLGLGDPRQQCRSSLDGANDARQRLLEAEAGRVGRLGYRQKIPDRLTYPIAVAR